MGLSIRTVALALCAFSVAWGAWNLHLARSDMGRIENRLDVALDRARRSEMVTTYTSTIDCCGVKLDIATTGGTITQHLAAVREAQEECDETCDK